jgi:hypothetical protein
MMTPVELVATVPSPQVPAGGGPLTLRTIRGNEPLWTFTIPAYKFTEHLPVAITLLVKANADTPDGAAFATMPATVTDPAGRFQVQVTTAATASPGRYAYKVVSTDAAGTACLLFGDFVVIAA